MYIYGLKCLYCQHALQSLGIENDVLFTKCSHCHHISRPKQIETLKNVIYSRFSKKNVEVQYNAKLPRSGEYRKVSTINENQAYPDRKKFVR